MIYYERRGQGEPVLLLHGTGSHCRVWDRVVPLLTSHAQTIALDLPGFGQSPPMEGPLSAVSQLVDAVEAFMDEQDLVCPHLVGNSAGGWIALELAKRGRARTVVALAPMGLWRTRRNKSPMYARLNFRMSYRAAATLRPWQKPILSSRIGRTVFMWQVMGRPWALTYEEAYETVLNFVDSPGVQQTADAVSNGTFVGGQAIDVPVTVAYGQRDRALLRHHRRREQLPCQTRWLSLPRCGHVPMVDDPQLVARVILQGTLGTRSATPRSPIALAPAR